jgi:hypothetical protein
MCESDARIAGNAEVDRAIAALLSGRSEHNPGRMAAKCGPGSKTMAEDHLNFGMESPCHQFRLIPPFVEGAEGGGNDYL